MTDLKDCKFIKIEGVSIAFDKITHYRQEKNRVAIYIPGSNLNMDNTEDFAHIFFDFESECIANQLINTLDRVFKTVEFVPLDNKDKQ